MSVKSPTYELAQFADPNFGTIYLIFPNSILLSNNFLILKSIRYSYDVIDSEQHEFTCGKSIIFALGSLTLRSWSSQPSEKASRIIFFK